MTSQQNGPRYDGPKCGARKKQGEGACTQAAGWGTAHPGVGRCKLHGGSTPNGDKAAASASARLVLAELVGNAEPVEDPLTVLAELAGEALRWKRILAAIVADLERLRYEGVTGAEQIDGRVVLFERAMDRCVNTLGLIARLKIDDRLVKIEEDKARLVEQAVEDALTAIGLTGVQAAEARAFVADRLEAVA